MKLSAIVPATDAPPTLARCLEAIRAADTAPEEVVVVTEPPRAGPAAARNSGAERSTGDVLVFVDADVVVHADAFARIRSRLEDGRLDAVFGSYDDEPEAPGVVSRFRNLLHHHVHQESAGPVGSFWAGLGAVRRSVFVAAGGFDAARYPAPAIEDVELGARLRAAGYAVELDPAIQGMHLKRWTLPGMLRTDALARGVPWVELVLEQGTLTTELNLGWRHRLSGLATLAAVGAVLRRRPAGAVAGLVALAALNARFYALLARKLGLPGAVAGLGLHALHHLAALTALPLGALRHVHRRRRT